MAQNETVIHLTTDVDESATLAPVDGQPVVAKPMEGVEKDALDIEM